MPNTARLPLLLTAAAALCAAIALLMLPSSTASAHPLGNFTINHYDRIEVSDAGIQIYRVLDMAEIPTFQERQKVDANGDGKVDDDESEAWAAAKADELRSNMRLDVNGRAAALSDVSHEITFPPGQGGLLLLRLTATYDAALPDGWRDSPPKLSFQDTNYGDRLGWREIIVRSSTGIELIAPSVTSEDKSEELTKYPTGALSSPLNVRSATFSFKPGIGAAPAPTPDHQTRAVRGNPDNTLARFANLIAKDNLSVGVVTLALLASLAFGGIHALSPGHGKTIVAAYLVGSRGTGRHALLLGLTVTATHTSSVYVLGFITLYLSSYIVPETLYPWLGVASGGLIVLMGLSLFAGRLRSSGLVGQAFGAIRSRVRAPHTETVRASQFALAGNDGGAMMLSAPTHADGEAIGSAASAHEESGDAHDHGAGHEPHDHDDGGEHKHGFAPAHSHTIPGQDGEPVTWRRLIGLGIFGGLLPCPSAIVVMLSAISLHRVGFGLVLILFFSLGLAGVLTGIGFALVYARTITKRVPLLSRIAARADGSSGWTSLAVRGFPVASAAAVVLAGAFVTSRAFGQF